MSVAISLSEQEFKPVTLERSRGDLTIRLERDGLKDLYQSGCLKARFPRTHEDFPTAVLINTAGGLTGGDELIQQIDLGNEAAACITSQAAERLYNRFQGQAKIETRLQVGASSRLEWLPQETIVFDHSA